MSVVNDSPPSGTSKTKKKTISKNKHQSQESYEEYLRCAEVDGGRQPRNLLGGLSEGPHETNVSNLLQQRETTGQNKKGKSRTKFLTLDSGKIPFVPLLTDTTSAERNAAIFSDVWIALSSIFCFTSSYYMPEDDYILYTGSDDDNDPPHASPRKKKTSKNTPESFIAESLKVFDWSSDIPVPKQQASNSFVFCREGDYANDKDLLGLHLLEEGQRIVKLFVGITRVSGLTFNWTLRASKKGITIHTSDVPNSPWQAVKSDCIIQQDKHEILKLLLDDSRSHEYDDSMEGFEFLGYLAGDDVRVRRYFYKAIWPTSARDFVMCSSWRELEDGRILMSTISPPDNVYAHTEGFVRAHINISGVLIRPIDARSGGGCAVTMIGHSDLKGSIPSAIVNMLSVGMPMTMMSKVKKSLEK